MPELGEIRRGCDIGRSGRSYWIWLACPNCGKERWVFKFDLKRGSRRCWSCAMKLRFGEKDFAHWKGGITYSQGYRLVKLFRDNPFFCMVDYKRYVREHRLIMATYLGRPLTKNEQVHHWNGIRDDNKFENLKLVNGNHPLGYREGYEVGYAQALKDMKIGDTKALLRY